MALREIAMVMALLNGPSIDEARIEQYMRPPPVAEARALEEKLEAEKQGMKPLTDEEERQRRYKQELPKIKRHRKDTKRKYRIKMKFSNGKRGTHTLTEWPKRIAKKLNLKKDEGARNHLFKPIFLEYLPIMTGYDYEDAMNNVKKAKEDTEKTDILKLIQENSDFPAVIAAMATLESKLRPNYGETNGYHGLLQINEGVLKRVQAFYRTNKKEFPWIWDRIKDIKPEEILDPINQVKIVNADITKTMEELAKVCPKIPYKDLYTLAAVGHNGGPNGIVRYVKAAKKKGKKITWEKIAFDYCSMKTVQQNMSQIEGFGPQCRKKWIMLRYGYEFEILREKFETEFLLKISREMNDPNNYERKKSCD